MYLERLEFRFCEFEYLGVALYAPIADKAGGDPVELRV